MTNPLITEFETLSDDIDGGDVFAILSAIAVSQDIPVPDFIRNDRLARDIINMTQSNYERAYRDLIRMAEIDEHLIQKEN